MSNNSGNGLWRFSKPDWLSLRAGIVIAATLILLTAACCIYYYYLGRKPRGCLDPNKFKEFKLIKKTQIGHNVYKFIFALPTPKSVLGVPVGKHLMCRGKDKDGLEVTRCYTPISLDSDLGYFELLVKMNPEGRMTHHFMEMREGDYLAVKGPLNLYKGNFEYKPGKVRAFGMIAGGYGIIPMFQSPEDKTKLHLIYTNTTFEDILLKPPEKWDGGVGYVTKEMIQQYCPAPAPDIQILIYEPQGMNDAVSGYLNELGYTRQMQFEF